jgi:hypothetical protein
MGQQVPIYHNHVWGGCRGFGKRVPIGSFANHFHFEIKKQQA